MGRIACSLLMGSLLWACSAPPDLDRQLRAVIEARGITDELAEAEGRERIDTPLARLGKALFFAKSLSGNMDVACASCHHPLLGGGDHLSLPVGVNARDPDLLGPGRRVDRERNARDEPSALPGPNVPRNSPTTFNVGFYRKALFHDGRVQRVPGEGNYDGISTPDSLFRSEDSTSGDSLVEAQSRFPITSHQEMRGFTFSEGEDNYNVRSAIARRLLPDAAGAGEGFDPAGWLPLFRAAFEDDAAPADQLITFENVSAALEAYQLTQVFTRNRFFAYVAGDEDALDEREKRGALLFYAERGGSACADCHSGNFFTDEAYYNLAVPQFGRGKDKLKQDYGRKRLTRSDGDKFAFRTPSLLNVAVTGPWGHTGAFADLRAAVVHHVAPRESIGRFDFDLGHLPQFRDAGLSWPRARENTQLALGHANLAKTAAYVDDEIDALVAFLGALTDPCVLSESCLEPWLPEGDGRGPDGTGLVAKIPVLPPGVRRAPVPQFEEFSAQAGIDHDFYAQRPDYDRSATAENSVAVRMLSRNIALNMSGGMAAGDVDGDGLPDLFLPGGKRGRTVLLRNLGDGRFADVTADSGIALSGNVNGATFADMDGDGHLDLLVAGLIERPTLSDADNLPPPLYVFRGDGSGKFSRFLDHGLEIRDHGTFSAAFGDYDLDGDLDLFLAHWDGQRAGYEAEHLWENTGGGRFRPAARRLGIAGSYAGVDFSFTPAFSDIDDDGWPDLLVVGDFETSQVFRNQQGTRFVNATNPLIINDENGMGSAIGDYDNDGDLDWFVSSIFDPDGEAVTHNIGAWGATGNRLYRNRGDGSFEDATDEAGVRDGGWGWGSCFADFDNDGFLDLFHVNGYGYDDSPIWRDLVTKFQGMPARMFIADGEGGFTESAAALGVADTGEGRAVSCMDYDRDGDIDLLIQNQHGTTRLYANRLIEQGKRPAHFLGLRLRGLPGNPGAAGARIVLRAGDRRQLREIRIGSNYLSQNPQEAHFGLAGHSTIDELTIVWPGPDRLSTSLEALPADQWLTVEHPAAASTAAQP